jgi:hypothetical protein
MNNKLFAALVVLILLPFFGWMYEDWQNDSAAAQKNGANRDLLIDEKGDATAEIDYIFHFPDPVYSHSLTTSQIEALSQSGGENYHVYGLTQAGYSINSLYEVNWSKKWFRPEYSVWVENLRVEFTYDTLNVFVTSTYPEGSCEYQATLDHENQHVAIHREMYKQYQEIFRQKVGQAKDIPLASSPLVAPSVEEGKTRIGQMISAALDLPFEQFKEALQAEQDKLDTPDSYAALKGKCQNW